MEDGSPYADWVYSATAGERIRIDLRSGDFDTFLRLGRMEGGEFVEISGNDDAVGTDSQLSYTAEASGDYIVRVSAFWGEGVGTYVLLVTPLPLPLGEPRGGMLSIGGGAEGTLTDEEAELPGEVRYQQWTFVTREAARYAVELSSSDFDPYLSVGRMVEGAFQEIAFNDDWYGSVNGTDSRVLVTLREPGTYVARVIPFGAVEVGDYRITVSQHPLPPTSPVVQPIALGQVVVGTLTDDDAQMDDAAPFQHWSFSARAGQILAIALSSDQFDTFVSVGRVQDGVFQELDSNDDRDDSTDSFLELQVPSDGEYQVRVRPFGPEERGEYRLEITSTP
jgi:hypothetical protein